ncbi:hypothetical protein Ciccas_001651 [Cichlidogyrus casuarinus]|uniref:Uncharacterized protein n=1 Tax=Cichlidogyrus casuarinus TaxID=1844966 RepID=A0ABD2QJE9_9PLAT
MAFEDEQEAVSRLRVLRREISRSSSLVPIVTSILNIVKTAFLSKWLNCADIQRENCLFLLQGKRSAQFSCVRPRIEDFLLILAHESDPTFWRSVIQSVRVYFNYNKVDKCRRELLNRIRSMHSRDLLPDAYCCSLPFLYADSFKLLRVRKEDSWINYSIDSDCNKPRKPFKFSLHQAQTWSLKLEAHKEGILAENSLLFTFLQVYN